MDELRAMSVFVEVAQRRSFTEAARALGTSRPSVSRQVALLERSLGAELFVRTTRTVALTQAGARYLEDARRILDAVSEARAAAAGVHRRPAGPLAVTAPVLFGRLHVCPVVGRAAEQFPALQVRLTLLDRVVRLVDEGFDIGVRISHLSDSSLIAARAGFVRRQLVGSPRYFAEHGTPRAPAELSRHTVIGWLGRSTSRWTFAATSVPIEPTHWTNDIAAGLALAVRGLGIVSVLSYQVATELQAGTLVAVLEDHAPPPLPVSVVRPAGRPSAKTRVFMDLALEELRRRSAADWRVT